MKAAVAVIVAVSAMLGALAPLCVPPAPLPQMAGTATSPSQAPSALERMDGPIAMRAIRPYFLENAGQLGGCDVLLYAQGDGMSVGFRRGGVAIVLDEECTTGIIGERASAVVGNPHVVEVLFEGCRDVAPVGVDEAGFPTNFLVGSDPSGWVSGARSFREVVYEGLWYCVDLRYYFRDGMLKYDVVVRPGGRVGDVVMRYSGGEGLRIDPATGDLLVGLEDGSSMRDLAPVAHQDIAGQEVTIDCAYLLLGDDRVGYSLGLYDAKAPVTIDPGLLYSSFLGSAGNDYLFTLQEDTDGSVYVAGPVDGPGFPVTSGSFDVNYSLGKFVVVKLDHDLTSIVFATFLGGKHLQKTALIPIWPMMMTIEGDGKVLITGDTVVTDLPVTQDALQPEYVWEVDSFILVLSADGSQVEYCSYFGGSWWDGWTYHRLAENGELWLYAATGSSDLPTTTGAYQEELNGTEDLYIAKLDPTLTRVLYCTYFGGSKAEELGSVRPFDLDSDGNIYLTGVTGSDDLPTTPEAYCTTLASLNWDAFVLKMDPNATKVLYCSYLGGNGREWPYTMSVRPDGTMAVSGHTRSTDFPCTADCLKDGLSGDGDCFVSVLDPKRPRLVFSTYLGGDGYDAATGAVYDGDTDVMHLVGYSMSSDLPTTAGCYNPHLTGKGANMYLMSMALDTRSMAYCTYVGDVGNSVEIYGSSVLVEEDGNLLVTISVSEPSFPTTSRAYDRSFNGGTYDAVLLRLDPRPVDAPPPPDPIILEPGDGIVNISWSPVVNESYVTTGYVVLRGEDPSTPTTFDVEGTTFTDRGVRNGVRYYYRVAARNSAGAGRPSEAQSTVPMGVPTEPWGLVATTGDGTVRLGWSAPNTTKGGQLLGYNIWKGGGPDALQPAVLLGAVTSWTDENVTVGERYYYRIVAFNQKGNGTASDLRDVVVTSPPGVPQSFQATSGPGRVDLAWTPPANMGGADLLGYHVLRGLTADSMTAVKTTLPSEVSYVDRDVTNGTAYFYGVRAFTLVSEGPSAGPLEAIPYGPPGAPEGLRAMPGDGQVLLEWSPPANDGGRPITGYRIYAGPSLGGLTLRSTTAAVTSHYLSDLANGEEVVLAVAALNEMGEGAMSLAGPVTPYGPPSRPMGLAISISSEGALLSWNPPDDWGGATSLRYRVERGTDPGALATLATVDGTGHVDATVHRGAVYHYRVLAINPLGIPGEPSETMVASVPDVPGQVQQLTARPGDDFVTVSWMIPATDGGAPVLNYTILRGVGDDELVPFATVSGNTTFVDDNVLNGQTYRYTIAAANIMGLGPTSPPVVATPMDRPNAPWDIGVESDGSRVLLRWKAPVGKGAPVTGYIIYRGADPDSLKPIAEVGDVLEYSDGEVEGGRTYFYSVAANSTVGEGARSSEVEVTVGGGIGTSLIVAVVLVAIVVAVVLVAMRWRHRDRSGHGRR